MPQATNLISIDDSMQAEALGSACLVAIIDTINILLIVLDRTIQNRKKAGDPCYQRNIFNKNDALFNDWKSNMDIFSIKCTEWILKHGISKCIWNDQICQSNLWKCFHYRNGEITTEIHLACALRFLQVDLILT